MNNSEFIAKFESGSIPASEFHHADHVRLAFAYLSDYPVLQALERFCASLKQFARAHGKEDLYHETITWAYVLLIHERMSRAERRDWEAFASENPDLLVWKDGILQQYYSEKTLRSPLAKEVFVFPDKLMNTGPSRPIEPRA
jgi:hypothetical protein